MSELLLDTHAWIWLAAGEPRLRRHARVLERAAAGSALLLSAISIYEATLIGIETESGQRRGRRAVQMKPTVQRWIRDAMVATRVVMAPLEAEISLEGALLQSMHPDPFDRLIVATAMKADARLVTADSQIIAFAKQAQVSVLEL